MFPFYLGASENYPHGLPSANNLFVVTNTGLSDSATSSFFEKISTGLLGSIGNLMPCEFIS